MKQHLYTDFFFHFNVTNKFLFLKLQKKKKQSQPSPQDIISKERQKDLREADELKSQMEEQRRKMFLKANEDEDKVIKKLEKQLGLNKCKNKKNFFSDDGLDCILFNIIIFKSKKR